MLSVEADSVVGQLRVVVTVCLAFSPGDGTRSSKRVSPPLEDLSRCVPVVFW